MDYVPIFKIAIELLQDVAFQNLESVSDALRHLVKNALNIAEHYANLDMDHAGKLFNSVMGNQRADGAFFTRPIAATMLAELALSASGDRNFLDEESWDSLRCFDPACGSGTILVAMMSAIKRRIKLAGGNEDTLKRFHRRAVERLIVGADINHVALQLAACQLTLGNLDVAYDQLNLHLMDYGPINPDVESSNVKTGAVELLLDERLFPNRDELSGLNQGSKNLKPDMDGEEAETSLGDHPVESPVSFVLMNPPFTPWTSIGTKYDRDIQQKIRKRLAAIWDKRSSREPLLNSRKTTPAPLFESMAISITASSDGIIGLVRPSIIATTEDAREVRKTMANLMHIDFILTSHDPTNFNMSWDTSINECLIVMSNLETNKMNQLVLLICIDFLTLSRKLKNRYIKHSPVPPLMGRAYVGTMSE